MMFQKNFDDVKTLALRGFLNGAAIAVLGFAVTACAGLDLQTDRQVSRGRLAAYLAANPDTDSAIAATMRRYRLRKGMTMPQVAAVWGAPVEVWKWRNDTVTQWLFACAWPAHCFPPDTRGGPAEPQRAEAYFEKGRLVRWWSP